MLDFITEGARREPSERRKLDNLETLATPSDRTGFKWSKPTRYRRTVGIAVGVVIHGGLLVALLNARLDVSVPKERATVWTSLLPMSQPRTAQASQPRIRSAVPQLVFVPTRRAAISTQPAISGWVATAPASAVSAPPHADSASAPLRLTLTRSELRALEAASPPTLSQRLTPPPVLPLLAQRLAPSPQFEEDDRNGIHTVRSHGGCYILVPSGQSQVDPFNHGGERLTGRATNDNC